jgi:hypothetical protein
MTSCVADLDIEAGGTDSALFPEQLVHSMSVENLTALPLRVRVLGAAGSRALLVVIEGGPVPLFETPPRAAAPQN